MGSEALNVWDGHNADCSAWRGTYDKECKGCLLDRIEAIEKEVIAWIANTTDADGAMIYISQALELE